MLYKTLDIFGFQTSLFSGKSLGLFLLLALAGQIAGCGSAGPYGFAREYSPLGGEKSHMTQVTEVSYGDIRRDPEDHRSTQLGWFGIVQDVRSEGGKTFIDMNYHTLQPRNLCSDERSSSCRVTVSKKAGGSFTAIVTLRNDETSGQDKVTVGSLLKVYGSPNGDFNEEGGPILQENYHRHWPRGAYVTTAARSNMRR